MELLASQFLDYRIKGQHKQLVLEGRSLLNVLSDTPNIYTASIADEILIGAWYEQDIQLAQKAANILMSIATKIILSRSKLNHINLNLSFFNMKLPEPVLRLSTHKNYGDAITRELLQRLSKKNITAINMVENCNFPHIISMGSILDYVNEYSIVWGSGRISKTKSQPRPKKILAVRGPLSRAYLIAENISCPKIYGDPALLLPLIYNPNIEIKYKYGLIPHYIDKDMDSVKDLQNMDNTLFINIATRDLEPFIDKMLSCQIIISSSLHGLIVAIAYGKPCIWMKFSDKIWGGTFKFHDFFYSLNFESVNYCGTHISESKIITIDLAKVKKLQYNLIQTCPYLDEDRRDVLISQL